jgi:hypothetical protein
MLDLIGEVVVLASAIFLGSIAYDWYRRKRF